MNIKEIAKIAGVSVATVSRVLNHPDSVAEKTRTKIQKIIDEEEYTPNWFAQGLNFNRTRTVGLIIPHNMNTAYMEIANGVEEVARQKGYMTLMCNMEKSPRMEKEYIDQLITRKVDGLILVYSTLDEEYAGWIEEKNVPTVFIGKNRTREEWACVNADCREGAGALTKHLMECGHKKIAMLCGIDPEPEMCEMLSGFRDAFGMDTVTGIKGSPVPDLIINVENNIEGGYIGMKRLISEGDELPSAVFAASDEIAYGAMDAIKDMNMKIPDDIAVVGFGNDRMSAMVEPKLTTVELPYRKMGIYGARILFDNIEEQAKSGEDEKHSATRKIMLQTKLRVRRSCGHKERIGEMF